MNLNQNWLKIHIIIGLLLKLETHHVKMSLQSLEAFVIFIFPLSSTLHQAPHHYRILFDFYDFFREDVNCNISSLANSCNSKIGVGDFIFFYWIAIQWIGFSDPLRIDVLHQLNRIHVTLSSHIWVARPLSPPDLI